MMTQAMSTAEQEYLQALVHRIATHIVEGSAAVQELKSTIARLKNKRSDIEYAVYEHWLKAAKTIEAAGKEKSSWEKFIKSLQMSYGDGDNKEILASGWKGGAPKNSEDKLLPIACKELWAHEKTRNNHVGISSTIDHRFVESVDHGYHFGKKSSEFKLDLSKKRLIAYDTKRLAQVAMTIGEPNFKTSKGKRKLEDLSEWVGEGSGGKKKKSFIQFTNGRKVDGEKVVALKKSGRCFYCEQKGHRAKECKDNPDIKKKP